MHLRGQNVVYCSQGECSGTTGHQDVSKVKNNTVSTRVSSGIIWRNSKFKVEN